MEASHNPVLVHVLNGLKNLMLLTVEASVANLNPRAEMRQLIMKQHKQIYQAIMAGKATTARKVAMAHVRFVQDSLRSLENQGAEVIRVSLESNNFHENPAKRY